MRNCSRCRTEDRPQLDNQTECSCGANAIDPIDHSPDCKAVTHEVVEYAVRFPKSELTPALKLSSYLIERGWALMRNGERYYRVKLLCRTCIGQEENTQSFKRDYEKACKAARGVGDQTYAQMLAQQSMI